MRSLILFSLFLFLFPSIHAQKSEEEIKIISYNIRLDASSDGDDNWHNRKEDLVDYLNRESPDFIGIQEALPNQLEFLNNKLGSYSFIGKGREGAGQGEYSALLYDSSEWKLLTTNTFWLSSTPGKVSQGWDAACKRVCTYGTFKNNKGEQMAVFNTHLDHIGEISRANSIQLILDSISTLEYAMPTILMGDFNFEPVDVSYKKLTSKLIDGWTKQKYRSKGGDGTFNGFRFQDYYERRIDYIFVDNTTIELLKYIVDKPLTVSQRHLSDHFPVILTIKLK